MASKQLFAAVAAVLCGLQCAAAASSRLRETPLNLQKMRLQGVDPVDPDGDHGPKRIAGFFELNRTEVRSNRASHVTGGSAQLQPHCKSPNLLTAPPGSRDVLLLLREPQ